jgi:hypothetical protein
MALKGTRKVEADLIRARANEAMEAGELVRWVDGKVDTATNLRYVEPMESGHAIAVKQRVVGILGDKVIAKPALAKDSSDADFAGIYSEWAFTEATPLFQEEGTRFVDEPVYVIRKGLVKTDRIHANSTPSGGMLAYAYPDGLMGVLPSGVLVGTWQTSEDTDGYAELYVDINIALPSGA